MLDLFLFVVICTITTYGLVQIYFNSKTFIGLRTKLDDLRAHAEKQRSYLLYTIATWLLSRFFIGFWIGVAVAAAAYVFTFNPQPFNTATAIVIGAALFSVGFIDLWADLFPTSQYPDDDYFGHFYPWHEEAEEEYFQEDDEEEDSKEDPKIVHETALLEDASDSEVSEQGTTEETTQEEEQSEQTDSSSENSEDDSTKQS